MNKVALWPAHACAYMCMHITHDWLRPWTFSVKTLHQFSFHALLKVKPCYIQAHKALPVRTPAISSALSPLPALPAPFSGVMPALGDPQMHMSHPFLTLCSSWNLLVYCFAALWLSGHIWHSAQPFLVIISKVATGAQSANNPKPLLLEK